LKGKKIIRILKTGIFILIFGSLFIGLASQVIVPHYIPELEEPAYKAYLVFEHLVRGIIIIAGAVAVYVLLKKGKKQNKNRRFSLIGFSVSALILICILPVVTGFWELYNVLMPFPWSTIPLQLMYNGHYFSFNFQNAFNGHGVTVLLIFYAVFNIAVFTIVLLFGRRVFCSLICVNFGAHAETLKEGFPLFGSRKKMKRNLMPRLKGVLSLAKWVFLTANLVLIIMWIGVLAGADLNIGALKALELIKYMTFELFLVLFAFAVLSGRTYCYYCPAGTMLSLIGKAAGHCVKTNVTHCIECGACNDACDMQIDIKSHAVKGEPVRSLLCVGCGACADVCPTRNLAYL